MGSTLLIVNNPYLEFSRILDELRRFISSGDVYYQQRAIEILAQMSNQFLEDNKFLSEMDYDEVQKRGLEIQDHFYIFIGDIFWRAMVKIGEQGKFFREFDDNDVTAFLEWLIKTIESTAAAYLAALDGDAFAFLEEVNSFLKKSLQEVYLTHQRL